MGELYEADGEYFVPATGYVRLANGLTAELREDIRACAVFALGVAYERGERASTSPLCQSAYRLLAWQEGKAEPLVYVDKDEEYVGVRVEALDEND